MKEIFFWGGGAGGGHACGFLFNFSKVTENAIVTIKLLKKNYAEFTPQIKKVFHFFGKVISKF